MLAAAVYCLSAKNTARIPLFHGRLLHAAFFSLLQGISPELSAYIHDTQRQKAFAISPLSGIQPPKTKMQNHRHPTSLTAHEGDMVFWRISAWNDLLAQSLQAIRPGTPIRIGGLDLSIENCMMSPEEHREAGCLSEEDLIAGCLSVPSIREITFSFRSPVSFRCFDRDFPWPLPEYIFGSLADKWALTERPLPIHRQDIRPLVRDLPPRRWHGQSRTVYLKEDRGTLAFEGEFSFDTSHLAREEQQLLLLLAQFSAFSGVGRLTGHGLGQTRARYLG